MLVQRCLRQNVCATDLSINQNEVEMDQSIKLDRQRLPLQS
jgi:hypothetical protein